jgi:hypothetical protein
MSCNQASVLTTCYAVSCHVVLCCAPPPQGVILDPSILMFAQQQQRAQGRSGRAKSLIFSDDRGRWVGLEGLCFGRGDKGSLSTHVSETDVLMFLASSISIV